MLCWERYAGDGNERKFVVNERAVAVTGRMLVVRRWWWFRKGC